MNDYLVWVVLWILLMTVIVLIPSFKLKLKIKTITNCICVLLACICAITVFGKLKDNCLENDYKLNRTNYTVYVDGKKVNKDIDLTSYTIHYDDDHDAIYATKKFSFLSTKK